jgi:hypothetical protein
MAGVTKFCAPCRRVEKMFLLFVIFLEFSARNLLHITFLEPRILRWLLDFWKVVNRAQDIVINATEYRFYSVFRK